MKKFKHICISTLVPLGIMGLIYLIAYLTCGAGLVTNDCYEQYVPFFNAYYDIIHNKGSMFYSLTGSMGYDFWAVFSYYLVSPLNLIMLLFDKADIIYVVNALIILKVAICGGTFSVFIKNRFPKAKCSRVVLFSVIYALNGFVAGYMWNIMWMDGIMLFPLVIMGLDILMREENSKWYWYTLFLALLIINSYFIGYISCIFIFLYFFTYDFKNFKDFIRKFLTIGLSSLLAIGISAVILFPSLGGLQDTSISSESLPAMEFYGNYVDSFKNIMVAVNPVGIDFNSNRANLFMTTFVLLMGITYFTTGSVKPSHKIRNGILLAIMLFSLNFKPLNFIWHGMHEQTGIPNRFSFLIIFMLITMAFEVCHKRKKQVKKSSMAAAMVLLLAGYAAMAYFNNDLIIPAVITGVILILYFVIMAFAAGKAKFVLIQVFAYGEIVVMLLAGIFTVSSRPMGDYGKYINDFNTINASKEPGFYREKIDEVYTVQEDRMNYDINIDVNNLSFDTITSDCRFLKNLGHLSIVNEATVYGINSMSLFNTFNNYALTELYCKTGATGGINNVMYFGENAFMDMLLGVKYYYTRYYDVNSSAYEFDREVGGVKVYDNRYALSTGYAIPESFAAYTYGNGSNPFTNMNDMSKALGGGKIYDLNSTRLLSDNLESDGTRTYGITADNEEMLIYVQSADIRKIDITVNGKNVYTGNRTMSVIDIGNVSKSDEINVILTYTPDHGNDITSLLYSASVDNEAIAGLYDELSKEMFVTTGYNNDRIKGSIELNEAGNVLFTIPNAKAESYIQKLLPENVAKKYEELFPAGGWKIKADGQIIDAETWNDVFIMLKLDAGRHDIEMVYVTPGFYDGALISIISAIIFIIALAVTLSRKHSRRLKENEPKEEAFEPEVKANEPAEEASEPEVKEDAIPDTGVQLPDKIKLPTEETAITDDVNPEKETAVADDVKPEKETAATNNIKPVKHKKNDRPIAVINLMNIQNENGKDKN